MCTGRAVTELPTKQRYSNRLLIYRSASTETQIENNLSKYLWQIAKRAHPPMWLSQNEKDAAHSLRVTAAVLIHMNTDVMEIISKYSKARRRGDSYIVYQRSTQAIQVRTTALDNLLPYRSNLQTSIKMSPTQLEQIRISHEEMWQYHVPNRYTKKKLSTFILSYYSTFLFLFAHTLAYTVADTIHIHKSPTWL